MSFLYFKEAHKQDRDGLFTRSDSNRMRGIFQSKRGELSLFRGWRETLAQRFGEAVDALEVFKARQDGALGNLV